MWLRIPKKDYFSVAELLPFGHIWQPENLSAHAWMIYLFLRQRGTYNSYIFVVDTYFVYCIYI